MIIFMSENVRINAGLGFLIGGPRNISHRVHFFPKFSYSNVIMDIVVIFSVIELKRRIYYLGFNG